MREIRAEVGGHADLFGGTCRTQRERGDYSKRRDAVHRIRAGDLFESDETWKAITFRNLRATGITWCAVRSDDPLKIMQRAGHADLATTQVDVSLQLRFAAKVKTLTSRYQKTSGWSRRGSNS